MNTPKYNGDLGAWLTATDRAVRAALVSAGVAPTVAAKLRVGVAGRTDGRVHLAGPKRAVATVMTAVPSATTDAWTDCLPAACTVAIADL